MSGAKPSSLKMSGARVQSVLCLSKFYDVLRGGSMTKYKLLSIMVMYGNGKSKDGPHYGSEQTLVLY